MKKEKEAPPVETREPKRSKNEQVEGYLSKWYDFRFNTVKCKPECKSSAQCLPPKVIFTLRFG